MTQPSGCGCSGRRQQSAKSSVENSAVGDAARTNDQDLDPWTTFCSSSGARMQTRHQSQTEMASPEWLALVPEMPALHATRAEVGKEQRTFVAGAIPGRRQRCGTNPRSNRSKELFSISSISTIRTTGNIEFSDSLDFCSPRTRGSHPKCLLRRSLVRLGDRRRGVVTAQKEGAG